MHFEVEPLGELGSFFSNRVRTDALKYPVIEGVFENLAAAGYHVA